MLNSSVLKSAYHSILRYNKRMPNYVALHQIHNSSLSSLPPNRAKVDQAKPAPEIKPEIPGLSDKERLQQDIQKIKDKRGTFISWNDFAELTKFKLSVLNTTVAAVAYFMTTKCVWTDFLSTSLFLMGTQLSAMSSQAMNQGIEYEQDMKMKRTSARPVPLGKFTPNQAKALSWGLLGLANCLLLPNFGWESAAVANAIFASYVYIYTPMKRTSTSNTHWGSLVGALVPYLGWMAGGGSFLSLSPLMMTLFIFSWQYPHFYGILWTYKEDYRKGGFKMIEDPVRAGTHVKLAFGGYMVSLLGLAYTGAINPFLTVPSLYWFYKYGWKPGVEFQKNPTVENAKKMKYGSYVPFTLFFGLLILGLAQKVYMEEFHLGKLKKEEENNVVEDKQNAAENAQ